MEETTVSTPAETAADTSANTEPETDTSAAEPQTGTETADTGNEEANGVSNGEAAPKLYAGKYKTPEDLEKGYKELEPFVNKSAEFEKKYNELVAKQQADAKKAEAERLNQAKSRGFNSVEAEKVANQVQLAEFEYYANNINEVAPENIEAARSALLQYYQTGHKAYLNEAKRYYSSDFIEAVRDNVRDLQVSLNENIRRQNAQKADENAKNLGESLRAEFSEFLNDLETNEGKTQALRMFCNAGFIQSKEDMQVFQDIYSKIANVVREQAIKEYEAQKAIDKTKQGAQIGDGGVFDSAGETMPTEEQLAAMTQEQYEAAVNKWGIDKLFK